MPRTAKRNLISHDLNTAHADVNRQSSSGTEVPKSILEPVKGLKSSISREFELSACGAAFSAVIGCDEAGRGPLCGPVVAAAAWVAPDVMIEHGINDSKATTEAQRVATYDMLVCHPAVKYAVVRIEHDEIDRINILQASLKAMRLACTSVLEQLQAADSSLDAGACLCLVDGNKVPSDMPVITRAIIKGDSLAFSIAAASIIAKVSRDRIMTAYAADYPAYDLAQHKGYPTLAHRTVLSRLGPSPIHRMSYRPVFESVKGYVKQEKQKKTPASKVKVKAEKVVVEKQSKQIVVAAKTIKGIVPCKGVTAAAPAAAFSSPSVRVTRSSVSRKRKEGGDDADLHAECAAASPPKRCKRTASRQAKASKKRK